MHRRFHRRVTLLTAALAVAIAATAYGFGTVNRFGQHAEHERITRASLACGAAGAPGTCFQTNSILNLAGGPGTFGGVGSPDSDEIFTPDGALRRRRLPRDARLPAVARGRDGAAERVPHAPAGPLPPGRARGRRPARSVRAG